MILWSHGMKQLAAEGLMYDPGLIKCAEFDWFCVRCLEDALSFTTYQSKGTSKGVCQVVSLFRRTNNNIQN